MLAHSFRCLAAAAVLCLSMFAAPFGERWVYYSGDLIGDDQTIRKTLTFLEQAQAAGVTHLLITDGPQIGREVPEEMLRGAARVLSAAANHRITIVPGVYPIGYSGRFLGKYPELAAGIPVRDARFVVKAHRGIPDSGETPTLENPGFENFPNGKIAGWDQQDVRGPFLTADPEIKHAGKASLKITALDKLPKESRGQVRLGQTLKVKPFHSYVFSAWIRSENLQAEGEDYVWLFSGNRQRRHSYTNLGVAATQDWTHHSIVFNSLEADTIDFSVGVSDAKRGTIWFDDVEIKPAGFTYLVRRTITPLSVRSEDGTIVYREGEDFEPLETQPLWFKKEVPAAPELKLTKGSRIRESQTLLVSFFHSTTIYNDQEICSIQEPRVFELMEEQVRKTLKVWPTGSLFMNYDEIRIGGWEAQPQGENLTPGQMLAQHVRRGVEIIRKHTPRTKIYVWSDMFDKYHNAFPFDEPAFEPGRRSYYLCKGNWDGSWEGLPREVVLMNWNGTENAAKSLRWFAGRGHRQVIAGYYDGDPRQNIEMWIKASEGVSNIDGMMYTTWQDNFGKMPEFFRLLRELSHSSPPARK